MSTRKLGRTQTWRFGQHMKAPYRWTARRQKNKARDERENKQMKDLQLYSWVKETDIPPNQFILHRQVRLDDWRGVNWDRDVCWRISRRQWEMTCLRRHLLHCQCVDYCCMQHGSIFEWKLETWYVLLCKQTHPVKCSPDTRNEKNARNGFGDYMERWITCEQPAEIAQNSWLEYWQNIWVSNVVNWRDVCFCMNRTKHVWYPT